ncbi:MAG: hypothetical protein LBJ69_01300 [Holosporales bacterium]|nr:hypothetical protein [Holosporales bacterium]
MIGTVALPVYPIINQIADLRVAIEGDAESEVDGLLQKLAILEKLIGHPATIQEFRQRDIIVGDDDGPISSSEDKDSESTGEDEELGEEGEEEEAKEPEPVIIDPNPPVDPTVSITPATGLYFATCETHWLAQANEWADKIINSLLQPEYMQWARPAIIAFLIAKQRTQATLENPAELDGGWMTGKFGGELSSASEYSVRYCTTKQGQPSGWTIAASRASTPAYATTDPTPTLFVGPGTQTRAREQIRKLETCVRVQKDTELWIRVGHGGGAEPYPELRDDLDAILPNTPDTAPLPGYEVGSYHAVLFEVADRQWLKAFLQGKIERGPIIEFIIWRADILPKHMTGDKHPPHLDPLYIEKVGS